MMTEEDLLELKWESKCQDSCYIPYDHSHNFKLGKDIKKICPNCNHEIKIDAQIFGNDFGKNRVCLYNVYECECGQKDEQILYDGIPKSYKDICEIVLNNFSNL